MLGMCDQNAVFYGLYDRRLGINVTRDHGKWIAEFLHERNRSQTSVRQVFLLFFNFKVIILIKTHQEQTLFHLICRTEW